MSDPQVVTSNEMKHVVSVISTERAREDPSLCIITLRPLLDTEEGRRFLSKQEKETALVLIELFDWALKSPEALADKDDMLWTLRQLCARQQTLPESCILPIKFKTSGPHDAAGGFADVWKGTYEGRDVAFKSVRASALSDGVTRSKRKRRIFKEVVLWKSLNHPNILSLIGVCRWDDSPDARLTMVSEWMANGSIIDFIKYNESQRMKLLTDCANGLQYLHSASLIHGDIKGENILVTSGSPARACLADFGFIAVLYDIGDGPRSSSVVGGGTTPFMAPELLFPTKFGKVKCEVSKEADVYAFGMAILQVLTGQMPFHTLRDSEISYKVIQGERPDLPANAKDLGISDKLWELLIRCWFGDCTDRPSISEILQHLSESAAREMIFPPLRYSPFPSCEGFSGSVGPERGVLVTSNVNSSKSSSAEAPNLTRLFSIETQSITPGTTPGNSKIKTEQQRPPVYETLNLTADGSEQRVRRIKLYIREGSQVETAITAWKQLAHRNVVPLLEANINPRQLVLDWTLNEDLIEYITNHPEADRPGLLSDIAEGLSFLHTRNVVHGNLMGSNILVNPAGCARITEIGLATITHDMSPASADQCDKSRWTAPEVLTDRSYHSKESDVFSFAMVVIETFAVDVPFGDMSTHEVVAAIALGERPQRPLHPALGDRLWALTQRCWDKEALLRPKASDILCDFDIPAWKRLITRSLPKDERISLTTKIFSDHDQAEAVKSLCGDDAQSFVDVLNEVLDELNQQLRRKCLGALRKICGRHGLLPRSMKIVVSYDRLGKSPPYKGGFAEVWKVKHEDRQVAVRVPRVYQKDDRVKIRSRFCKEVVAWRTLRHPNVLPLLGVMLDDYPFAMVSAWMENGNINEFIQNSNNPDVNRPKLLKDVANGLIYLHAQGMVHADLKGDNILIDDTCRARLADFGLLTILSDPANPVTPSPTLGGGTVRWMSPELLDPEQFGLKVGHPTKESDCYALGMVILEVLSDHFPYDGIAEAVVIRMVTSGEFPGRPTRPGFTDDVWRTLERCWSFQPEDRPNVETVLRCLKHASKAWDSSPSDTGDDAETDMVESSSTMSGFAQSISLDSRQSCTTFSVLFFFFLCVFCTLFALPLAISMGWATKYS